MARGVLEGSLVRTVHTGGIAWTVQEIRRHCDCCPAVAELVRTVHGTRYFTTVPIDELVAIDTSHDAPRRQS